MTELDIPCQDKTSIPEGISFTTIIIMFLLAIISVEGAISTYFGVPYKKLVSNIYNSIYFTFDVSFQLTSTLLCYLNMNKSMFTKIIKVKAIYF